MSHPEDITEHPPSEDDLRPDDLRLIDLLYGDLEDDIGANDSTTSEAPEREHLHSEIEQLSFIRTLFQELPDEEPPAAITAKLLHAAAIHAPTPTAKPSARSTDEHRPGFWSWFAKLFQPVVMYPGFAAAASLVLVAVVAGSMYMSRDSMVATTEAPPSPAGPILLDTSPRRSAEQAPRSPTSATAILTDGKQTLNRKQTPLDQAPTENGKDAEMHSQSKTSTATLGGAEESNLGERLLTKKTEAKKSSRKSKARKKTRTSTAKRPARTGRMLDEPFPGGSINTGNTGTPPSRTPTIDSTDSSNLGLLNNEVADEDDDASGDDVVQEAPEAESRPTSSPAKPDNKTKSDADANPNSARIRSLHSEARDAAKQNNCATVKEAGAMIKRLDAAYHRNTFVNDKSLARCFTRAAE